MASQSWEDRFGARTLLAIGGDSVYYYRLARLEALGMARLSRLPFSIRLLLESLLRQCNGLDITEDDVIHLAGWDAHRPESREIPFKPARVLLQDFTGVPCLVDLAALRDAMRSLGGDPARIQPQIPVDLVMDHSLQVDYFGTDDALRSNSMLELQRNRERYQFIRWGQQAFQNLRVVPPGSGIVHQVNLEYLAKGVLSRPDGGSTVIFPDSVVGADSHTTMINSLGIVGWGVGGIEAEAAMLGQPVTIRTPDVIGVKIVGTLAAGATATDLALTVTQMLRRRGVVEKFVEFYGPGLSSLPLPDRATIANMAPEYGATVSFFPVDAETLSYLRRTGRTEAEVALVERYYKEQGLFRTDDMLSPDFTDTLEIDLSTIEPSVAGPKRPQDRMPLADVKKTFNAALRAPITQRGYGLDGPELDKRAMITLEDGSKVELKHGAIVLAAITSCTNTSNPSVMVGAGLLARNAVARGLRVPPYVKTSLTPGSRVVTDYLREAGLLDALSALGFHVVGYGCATCVGNSGPIPARAAQALSESDIVASAVLSGNRNFEGRIHPLVKANFLASPPLVVAYALAGTVTIDLASEPLGIDADGDPVFLRDIWPNPREIVDIIAQTARPEVFRRLYENVSSANAAWNAVTSADSLLYPWDDQSTYIQRPPFFEGMNHLRQPLHDIEIENARILAMFGDNVTTDHISPAGSIPADSPAGRFLTAQGVSKADFNQYGTRRGNHAVMMRGTFANLRIKNLLVPGVEGGITVHYPDLQHMSIFDAALEYERAGIPLVVIAGKEYGQGSSRDWAAKGTALLGVQAVIAESFERTHRSNLVGMGVLPLQFKAGQSAASLGIVGHETLTIRGIHGQIVPQQDVLIDVSRPDGSSFTFNVTARLDTPIEVRYYAEGGILPATLRTLLHGEKVDG